MINVFSIVTVAFAIIGVIATILWLADTSESIWYRRSLYASTRHKLPRATVRKLRANRMALHESLLNRMNHQ